MRAGTIIGCHRCDVLLFIPTSTVLNIFVSVPSSAPKPQLLHWRSWSLAFCIILHLVLLLLKQNSVGTLNAFEVATGLVVHGAHRSLMWIHVEYQWSMKGLWLRLFHTVSLFHSSQAGRMEASGLVEWPWESPQCLCCCAVHRTAHTQKRWILWITEDWSICQFPYRSRWHHYAACQRCLHQDTSSIIGS